VAPFARRRVVVRLRHCSAVLGGAAIVVVLGGIGLTTTLDGLFDVVMIGLTLVVVAGVVFVFSLWIWRTEGDGQAIEEDDPAAAP
jgi:hypothetical protein